MRERIITVSSKPAVLRQRGRPRWPQDRPRLRRQPHWPLPEGL